MVRTSIVVLFVIVYDNETLVSHKDPDDLKFYYHPDHLGSTTLVTNESGDVVEETTYEPFGKIIEGGDDRFLYTGKELDKTTNLEYYGARYYSPELGKFVEPDSNLPNVYDSQQLNRYAYTRNNPLKYTDKDGNSLSAIATFGIGFGLNYGISVMTQWSSGKVDLGRAAVHAISGGVGSSIAEAGFSSTGFTGALGDIALKRSAGYGAGNIVEDVIIDTFFKNSPGRSIRTGLSIEGFIEKDTSGNYVPPGAEFGLVYYPETGEFRQKPTEAEITQRIEQEQKLITTQIQKLDIDTTNLDVKALSQAYYKNDKGLTFNDYVKKYYTNYQKKQEKKGGK